MTEPTDTPTPAAAPESATAAGETPDTATRSAQIIRMHMFGSIAAGLIPIPIVDLGVLAAVQLHMVTRLAELYKVDFAEQRANAIIGSLASIGVASTANRLLRLVPGVGKMLASVGAITLPAASTYALGRVFVEHFESGGTFLTFDTERAKKKYEQELEAGKRIVHEQSFAGVKP